MSMLNRCHLVLPLAGKPHFCWHPLLIFTAKQENSNFWSIQANIFTKAQSLSALPILIFDFHCPVLCSHIWALTP